MSGRPPVAERLARLLAIVPWVAAHDGPPVSEVCERFAVSEEDLLGDLELLFLCGVFPFTPDALIEVDVADGRVWIRFADYFRRPLRLSASEGLALLGAGRALLGLPGADPDGLLASAIDKLGSVLGVDPDGALEVHLGGAEEEVLATVRAAAATRHKLAIEYYSSGRDEWGRRVVAPWHAFSSAGQWYVRGWCEQAGGERLFRVDRIRSAQALGESFERPAGAGESTETFRPDRDVTAVELDVAAEAGWVAEQYPTESVVAAPDGHLTVRLAVGERAWLERLLLRTGPAVVVRAPAELSDAGAVAARRLLRRYET